MFQELSMEDGPPPGEDLIEIRPKFRNHSMDNGSACEKLVGYGISMQDGSQSFSKEKKLKILTGIFAVLSVAFLISTIAVSVHRGKRITPAMDKGNEKASAMERGNENSTSVDRDNEIAHTAGKGNEKASAMERGNENSTSVDRVRICSTNECLLTARRLQSKMDEAKEPCHDFYSFACGNYGENSIFETSATDEAAIFMQHAVLELLNQYVPSEDPRNATSIARILFRQCIVQGNRKTEGLAALNKLLRFVLKTSWPIASEGVWNPDGFSWSLSVATALRYLDQDFFFRFQPVPDQTNSTNYFPVLVPDASFFKDKPYYNLIKNVVCKLNPNCQKNKLLDQDIRILTLISRTRTSREIDLTRDIFPQNSWSMKNLQRVSLMGTKVKMYSIAEFQKLMPKVNWTSFFDVMFNGTNVKTNKELKILTFMEILQPIVDGFDEISPRNLANIIGWEIVRKVGVLLSTDVSGMLEQEPFSSRVTDCLPLVQNVMGFAVGKMYSDTYMSSDTLEEAIRITSDIKTAFGMLVNETDWMDTFTRTAALNKIKNIKTSVAAPDWALDTDQLNEHYKSLRVLRNLSFEDGVLLAKDFYMRNLINLLTKKVDRRNDWGLPSPITVNAFYEQPTNSMIYPMGILSYMFFNRGRPRSINFGRFGFVGGHEVTHGFDSEGKNFDENGTKRSWWSKESTDRFQRRADCFKEQYSSIKDELTGLNLNGEQTLGENIADNGALAAAFKAYKVVGEQQGGRPKGMEKYTEDQLFFISAAQTWCTKVYKSAMEYSIQTDVHSPYKYRVIVPFQNFPEFSKAFSCAEGTTMNPRHKCKLW